MSFGRWLKNLFGGGPETDDRPIRTPAFGHIERYDAEKQKGVILLEDGRALRFRLAACHDFDPRGHHTVGDGQQSWSQRGWDELGQRGPRALVRRECAGRGHRNRRERATRPCAVRGR
jgi:hypothetical protein